MPNMPPVTHDASADTESGEASEVLSEPSEPSVDSTPPRMTLQLHAIGALGQRGTSPVKLDVHSSFPSGGFLLPFSDGDSSRTAISTRTSGRLTHGTARTDGTDTADEAMDWDGGNGDGFGFGGDGDGDGCPPSALTTEAVAAMEMEGQQQQRSSSSSSSSSAPSGTCARWTPGT